MNQIFTTIDGTTFTLGSAILEFSYLLAAVMFVIGLKLLSHPESARKGNLWAASGMVLAMITTLLLHKDSIIFPIRAYAGVSRLELYRIHPAALSTPGPCD